MRLRSTIGVAVGSLVLALALPTSAHAATGSFAYTHLDEAGEPHRATLVDPPSRECVTLPEVADDEVPPAHAPSNGTDSFAVVFTEPDCAGDHFTLRPGGKASERLKLRSVVFA